MARDDGAGAVNVLLAFLLGAVSGAAVALLYAPSTGRETREYLAVKAREGRVAANDATVRGREAIKQGREAIKQGRDTLSTAIDRGREAYQKARAGDSA
jgi:gas vesicle protein